MYQILENQSIRVPKWDDDEGEIEGETKIIIPKGEWAWASIEALRQITETGPLYLIWASDSTIYEPDELCEPLLVDASSAQAHMAVYNEISEKNRGTYHDRIKESRLWFGKLSEFVWKVCKFA